LFQSSKALLTAEQKLKPAYFKMGLDFNPKGGSVSDFKAGGGAPAAPAAPDAPDAPDAPMAPDAPSAPAGGAPSKGGGGMEAVFASITIAADSTATETFKLKKVTKEMKKQLKDGPSVEPKKQGGGGGGVVAKKKVEEKKQPSLQLQQGGWMCEYYTEPGQLTLADVQMKHSVAIVSCKNQYIKIPDKVKAVTIANCFRTTVEVSSVVSIVELINSDACSVFVTEYCPSVTIDKTQNSSLRLSAVSVNQSPDIITSNVSALNLVIPRPNSEDDGDIIEIPLPEQFSSKYDPKTKKITTVAKTLGA